MSEPDRPELMTVAEVAERLRVSEQTVYRLNRKGKLHGHSVSRRAMRFRTEEIDALIGATLGNDAEPQSSTDSDGGRL